MAKKNVRIRAPKRSTLPAAFQGERWRSTAEFQIYLLWVRKNRPNGLVENTDLRAVDTSKTKVETHAAMIQRDEPDANAIWIEERVTNHLYGQRDVALAFRMGLTGLWKRDEPV